MSGTDSVGDPAGADHHGVADTAALEALGVGAGLGEVAELLACVAHHGSVHVILRMCHVEIKCC